MPVNKKYIFDNKINNHFEKINKLDHNKIENKYKMNTGIDLPARMLFLAPSGGCKNNLVIEFLRRTPDTFDELHICAKNPDQPCYTWLQELLGDQLTLYEVGEIPSVDDFEPDMNRLIIFDDYANDKKAQKEIIDWFIRGRHKKFSSIFLTQSYHRGTDKMIRQNCDYLFILKVNSSKDLKMILAEAPFDIDIKELTKLYSQYTKKKADFLLIDLLHENIRHNFLDIVYENSN